MSGNTIQHELALAATDVVNSILREVDASSPWEWLAGVKVLSEGDQPPEVIVYAMRLYMAAFERIASDTAEREKARR